MREAGQEMPRPRVDGRRVTRLVLLTAWAAFLAWLQVSGEIGRYIGPRTYWVVDLGAIALGFSAAGHLFSLRSTAPAGVRPRELLGGLVLLAPILAVVLVPAASLGSLAASHKAISRLSSGSSGTVPVIHDASKGVSVVDIHYASESADYAAEVGITDGYRIALLGFVTHPSGTPSGDFALTRFFISCCAADAIPYSVEVDPGAAASKPFRNDTWLVVRGVLRRRGDEYVLEATRIEPAKAPKDPYLY
jgi:uncharacterized repeat protein (TIGR03943 family)